MRTLTGRIAKSFLFLKIIGFIFSQASFFVPGKRLCETRNWMAIRHPKPVYPVHILIIPKQAIADWLAFPVSEPELFSEFVELSQRLIREEGLEKKAYRLIVNGGDYQFIPQLHVHLVSGDPVDNTGRTPIEKSEQPSQEQQTWKTL